MTRTNARMLLLVALVSVLPLAGCGASDEDTAGEAARDYIRAFGEKNAAKACDLLSASAKTDLVNYVSVQLPEVGTTKCEDVFGQFLDLTDERVLAKLKTVDVARVEVTGQEATVELEGAPMPAKLRKIEGKWLISELDFSGTGESAGASEGAPTPEPTLEETPTPDAGAAEVARTLGRLEGAGFKASDTSGSSTGKPQAVGEIEVRLGGGAQVAIYLMASTADAATLEKQLSAVEDESPDQIELDTSGTTVYIGTIEEPATFPADKLQAVISAAEGG